MNKKYLLAIPAILIVIGCGSSGASESDIDRLNEQANGNATVAPTKAPKVTTITEGDWEVGAKDNFNANILSPGTYVVTSPEDGVVGCYWTVVKDFSGDLDSYITAGNVEKGKSGRLVVKKSHGGVSFTGDCLAKKKE